MNNNWISVKDMSPEGICNCLIYYCEDWNHDKLNKIAWAFYNSYGEWCVTNCKVKPTHWQPLPKPPKDN